MELLYPYPFKRRAGDEVNFKLTLVSEFKIILITMNFM